MKILLVTRGSQGDIYPYLAVASELQRRGHTVTLSLPQLFEKQAKEAGVNYRLQDFDDIGGMIDGAAETKQQTKHLLAWMRRVIDMQFEQLIPLLQEHDLLIASNTEFAAASLAEYCGKPVMRTAFAPFIPGKKIPPPIMPFPKPHPVFRPALLWKVLNIGTNLMVKQTVNKNRIAKGMEPIRNFGIHAVSKAKNFLMYSPYLGSTDSDWPYDWTIGGYCFNDRFSYNEAAYQELMAFIRADSRPSLFFTLGSCNDKHRDRFCSWLLDICRSNGYKLIIGSGWSEAGSSLVDDRQVYRLTEAIPHSLVFPGCAAVIHHGGCGTTHSVARAGIPQMVVPLLLDQPYWNYRVSQLGAGPAGRKPGRYTYRQLEAQVRDLLTNPLYKQNAAVLGEQIRSENGVYTMCDYIERTFPFRP
ncbi:MAG: glycosyltransferase [Tannerellaceae bacterium]|nr:glycosyltransferase [Tannerellaceae bacterium]